MCAIRRIRGTDEWIVQSPPSHGGKTGWCPTCPPVQKETPVIAKESPDEFGELAWRRANKTDKPEVRTMSQANMLKLSRESDRFTIGDIEAGSINGTVTISRYSGGFMLTKKSLAKPPVLIPTTRKDHDHACPGLHPALP